MLKQLRIKFVAVVMVIVTVMLCLVFGMLYHFTRINLESESIRMMQSAAEVPFQSGPPSQRPGEVHLPYFILRLGGRGELIAQGGGYYDLTDEAFLRELVEAVLQAGEQTGILEDYGLRFCTVHSPMGQEMVFADISSERSTLKHLVQNCVLIGVLCLAVFFGLSLLLARWAVRPVEKAWKQQRQFVADASHELKTPLTVIMTNAELLQGPDGGGESRSQFSGNILTMSRQMRNLVERLLELARADNEGGQERFVPVDYSALVENALLPFEPVFFEKGLELSVQAEPGIVVNGSEQHLRQMVEILLDNAQKYSGTGGPVVLRLQRAGRRHCRLSLSNPGETLSGEELKNIFKRFYRVDKARSRDGGFGLGLSIAESIASAHHGRIWAESNDGIITLRVELPVKAQ